MRYLVNLVYREVWEWTFAQKSSVVLIAATLLSFRIRLPALCAFIFAVASGGAMLVVVLFFLVRRKGVAGYVLFLCLFILALAVVQVRSIPPSIPHEKTVTARLRLVSYPHVSRSSIRFNARLTYINGRRVWGRVLFSVPFTAESIERGDLIEVQGMFFALPFERSEGYARYLQSSGIEAVFEGFPGKVMVIQSVSHTSPIGLANRLKSYIENVHKGLLPPAQEAFATALLTGNRDHIPREIMDVFRRSGTMHILAVSGLHVGFLSLFLLFLLRLVRIPKLYAYAVVGLFIVFFMIFIGERPSVQRASLMALCGIACFLFDRDRNYLNVISLCFVLLWLVNPLSLLNPGFLLSFCATFGILFLTPVLYRWLSRFVPRYMAGSLAVTLSVQLFIFPVMIAYFGTFAYINLIANLPIVPLTGFSLALGVLTLIFYPLFLPLAVIFAEVNTVIIAATTRLAAFFAHAPPLQVGGFPMFIVPVYLFLVSFALWLLKRYVCEADKASHGV